MFPVIKERVPKKAVKLTDTIPVFCDCRMPEDNSMVQCSGCNAASVNSGTTYTVWMYQNRHWKIAKSLGSATHVRPTYSTVII